MISPQQKAISIKLGKSKSGPCPDCINNAKGGGGKNPPLHPNCRCSVLTNKK